MQDSLNLKEYFLFTQYSLATFDSCPLKFRKRYLENLKWDSFPHERIKKLMEKGRDFHLLAQRYFMGINMDEDILLEQDKELANWFCTLRKEIRLLPDFKYLPEYKLRMNKGIFRIEANFDLVMAGSREIIIWDWKTHGNTGSKRSSATRRLEESLQTIVYLYVLKEQASLVAGKETECSAITMNYWQPDPPGIIASIRYSEDLHRKFEKILESKIKNVLSYDYKDFDKELFQKHCPYCEFSWFCNNENINFDDLEDDDMEFDFDWETVEENY